MSDAAELLRRREARGLTYALTARAAFMALGAVLVPVAAFTERRARGLPEVGQGIGLHAGPAAVGNVGTPERLEFTVIGATVNTANRVERACKTVGADLLISEAVRKRLKQPVQVRPVGPLVLSGQQSLPLYEVSWG
jgi:class 3 adenylate cyclase